MRDVRQDGSSAGAGGRPPISSERQAELALMDLVRGIRLSDLSHINHFEMARQACPGEAGLNSSTFFYSGFIRAGKVNLCLELQSVPSTKGRYELASLTFMDAAIEDSRKFFAISYDIAGQQLLRASHTWRSNRLGRAETAFPVEEFSPAFKIATSRLAANAELVGVDKAQVELRHAQFSRYGVLAIKANPLSLEEQHFNAMVVQLKYDM